jgi:hypothetical protein
MAGCSHNADFSMGLQKTPNFFSFTFFLYKSNKLEIVLCLCEIGVFRIFFLESPNFVIIALDIRELG